MTTNTTATNLPALPRLPRSRKAKPPQECACGCGGMTRGGRFVPGHDAILHGWTIRVERGIVAQAPQPHTDAVAANVAHRAGKAAPETTAQRKARLKAERKTAKEAAKLATAPVADGTEDAEDTRAVA